MRSYWSLLAAAVFVGAFARDANPQSKRKTAALPAEQDVLTEWQLIYAAAIELRKKIEQQPRNEALRQKMTDLAVRSAIGDMHTQETDHSIEFHITA